MSGLRPMTNADLPKVMDIIGQAQAFIASQGFDQWQDGYPEEALMREDIALSRGYVLEENGQLLGIATVDFAGEPSYDVIYDGAWTTPAPYAAIHRVAMDAAARGTGAADRLMAACEQVVRERGVRSIRIDTHPQNTVMQHMLTRNGYALCGKILLAGGTESGAERVALEKRV